MTLVRRLARPMLAAVFVKGGADTLRDPGPRIEAADEVAPKFAAKLPYLPQDTSSLVRLNAGTQVAAGLLLAMGRLPRLSALVLAATLVPTAMAEQEYWRRAEATGGDGDGARESRRNHLLKDVGLIGGLLLAAVDTSGRPSLSYRAQHAAAGAATSARRSARTTRRGATSARRLLPG